MKRQPTPAEKLAQHIMSLQHEYPSFLPVQFAEAVTDNPQRHIDALVEAGVLEKQPHYQGNDMYSVVQPHEHEWRVVDSTDMLRRWVTVACMCGERHEKVPNRIPIEVPS